MRGLRVTYRQEVQTREGSATVVRTGTLTGETSEEGMLRVEWDRDSLGRMGWLRPDDVVPL